MNGDFSSDPPLANASLAPVPVPVVYGSAIADDLAEKCNEPPNVRQGIGAMVTGLALAGQGLAFHIAQTSVAVNLGNSDPLGFGTAMSFGLGTLSYVSHASSLSLLGVSSYRRGRWNHFRVSCRYEKRTKPRLGLGLTLLSLGSAMLIGNFVNSYYFRPDCDFCNTVVFQTGSYLSLALLYPGLALTTYSMGYRR